MDRKSAVLQRLACAGVGVEALPAARKPAFALPDQPDAWVGNNAVGHLLPRDLPWGSELIFAEGQVILPGASGAAANVTTAATAAANASEFTLASSATAALVSATVPQKHVGIVTAFWARPLSRLGLRSGHVTFSLDVGGRRTQLPTRFLGVRGSRKTPYACAYPVGPGKTVSLYATNGSSATWHAVEGWFEYYLMDERLYRVLVGNKGV